LRFHPVSNDGLIAYSKSARISKGVMERILTVVNLHPSETNSGLVELPLLDWGIDPHSSFEVFDLLSEETYHWSGWRNFVELQKGRVPAHIFSIRVPTRAEV
jgi:starch synthase (maltosyl-transferring)